MNLHHLYSAPHVELYFDTSNNWLFIDWEGDLTLANVQHACLEIGRCYLGHAFPRVLNSNMQVSSITPDVAAWLADNFMSVMSLAGVKQLAWVLAPTLRVRNGALDMANRLPHLDINLFEDMLTAMSWLQQTAPPLNSGLPLLPHPLAQDDKVHQLVDTLAQQLHAAPTPG